MGWTLVTDLEISWKFLRIKTKNVMCIIFLSANAAYHHCMGWRATKLVIELTKGVMAATGWLIVSAMLTLTAGYLTDALTVVTP